MVDVSEAPQPQTKLDPAIFTFVFQFLKPGSRRWHNKKCQLPLSETTLPPEDHGRCRKYGKFSHDPVSKLLTNQLKYYDRFIHINILRKCHIHNSSISIYYWTLKSQNRWLPLRRPDARLHQAEWPAGFRSWKSAGSSTPPILVMLTWAHSTWRCHRFQDWSFCLFLDWWMDSTPWISLENLAVTTAASGNFTLCW